MSTSVSKNLRLLSSALRMEEETKASERQGIGAILWSDCERVPKSATSLRRTLSADMSSKKWLAQHEISQLKKVASSQELIPVADSSSSSCEGEEEYEERKKELERPGQFDIWSSIVSQKVDDSSNSTATAPYIHPLVKRIANSLSKMSLEICTESLGSETGSDGFSSYPPSEIGDIEEDIEEEQQQAEKESQVLFEKEEMGNGNYSSSVSRKSPPRSFPPPLPSLSLRDMRSHRKDGRLVLEAVPVPSQNYLHAERQDGRLLLTFINSTPSEENQEEFSEQEEEEEEEFEEFGVEEEEQFEEDDEIERAEEENGVKKRRIVMMDMKVNQPLISNLPRVINVHRSALAMKKSMDLINRNPTWFHMSKKIVNLEGEGEEEEPTPLPQSLPPPSRVPQMIPSPPSAAAAAASFNHYEYCWRSNPRTQQLPPPINNNNNNNNRKFMLSMNQNPHEQQQNKADYLAPVMRGCKKTRRSKGVPMDLVAPLHCYLLTI